MIGDFYKGLLGGVPSGPRLFKLLLRASISIAVLSLLFWWLPTDKLLSSIAAISPSLWLLIFVGFLCGHIISAFKWRFLLQSVSVDIGKVESVRAHGAGLFANMCLPSVVGGDLVRAGVIIRSRGEAEAVALGSLADRLNDTLALLVLAAVAGLFVPASVADVDANKILTIVAALLLFVIAFGISSIHLVPLRYLPGALRPLVAKFKIALASLFSNPHVGLIGFFLSLAIQSGFILLNIAIANEIGISASIYIWFFAWPLAKLIALIPVSLGGIGVREAALSALLVPFGVEGALAVAQGLSWQLILMSAGLFAGLVSTLLPGYTDKK
jgi:uncharacterized protein (TIRG00374 family)